MLRNESARADGLVTGASHAKFRHTQAVAFSSTMVRSRAARGRDSSALSGSLIVIDARGRWMVWAAVPAAQGTRVFPLLVVEKVRRNVPAPERTQETRVPPVDWALQTMRRMRQLWGWLEPCPGEIWLGCWLLQERRGKTPVPTATRELKMVLGFSC